MRKITLGTTYYNNPDYLKRFVKRNLPYVDELIIVDDGSSLPITDYLSPGNKIRIFQVLKDYGFNSHGCRNLIMKQTTNDWVVLIDIDREFLEPEFVFNRLNTRPLNESTLYRFVAHSSLKESHKSVNDYLINRHHFFSAGGYDEEIIGQRWGDREYFKQLLHYGNERILLDIDLLLTRQSSVKIKGRAVSPFDIKGRKGEEDVKRRIKTPEPNKPILTFDWMEIV